MITQFQVRHGDQDFVFETESSLFSPNQLDSGSRLLLDSIAIPENAKSILDIGCGYGAIGIILAKLHPDKFVFLIDNDPIAFATAKKNVELNGLKNAKIFKSDVTYSTLPQKFDVALSNPPWSKNVSVNPALVKFAFENLNTNGIFASVINKSFCLQDEMEKVFGNVKMLCEESLFKILLSKKV